MNVTNISVFLDSDVFSLFVNECTSSDMEREECGCQPTDGGHRFTVFLSIIK